ncbi:hypothetical protein GCM10023205_00840 [Yinghuangia aomiensis]|uniref:Uncharacterized protein n=1 Tax=Yinghuangia aomiensis TaxID=676205 RepID=A0ABP9GIL8_9ACTN
MSSTQPQASPPPEGMPQTSHAKADRADDGPKFRGPFKRERRRVHEWRHARPFWAGFFILLGSVPILYFPYATLRLGDVSVTMTTMAGAASAIIGTMLILLAVMIWFQPQFRMYAGVVALVCGFISFITSNLGGFFMGLLSVSIGGTLALAWAPDEDAEEDADPADPASGDGGGESDLLDGPHDGLDIFVPPPAPPVPPSTGETTAVQPAVSPPPIPPQPAPEPAPQPAPRAGGNGGGLGEPWAGSAPSRPGSTPDPLNGSSRPLHGAAKFTAIAGFPAVALVAALLPMAGPSDPLPPNPFADGPCASASPSASASASASASPSAAESASASPSASASASKATAGAASSAPAKASTGTSAAARQGVAPQAPAPGATPQPSGTPTTAKPGLLDPLKDLLSPILSPLLPKAPTTAPPAVAPAAPVATSAPSTPAPGPTTPSAAPTGAAPSTTKATTKATAKPTATPTAEPSGSASPSASASATGDKPAYPCPTEVPLNAKAAAPGEPVLPDQPWILKTSLLAMAGMDYKGVVNVTTGSGKTKPVLKFEVSAGVDIWNLDMTSPEENGRHLHVFSTNNVKSYMKDGTVTFYTESLKGNLFGLIPVEFTPTTPPPLNVPVAFFTDVTVTQAGQTGATLVIPDMTMRIEKP